MGGKVSTEHYGGSGSVKGDGGGNAEIAARLIIVVVEKLLCIKHLGFLSFLFFLLCQA